jgi:hypothetical protein
LGKLLPTQAQGVVSMNSTELMNRLLKLERAIGIVDAIQLRSLVMDAQVALLEMQRNSLTTLHAASRMAPRPEPWIPSWRETVSAARRISAVAEESAEQAEVPFAVFA